MKFTEKIRKITKEAKNIEHVYPYITKVIEGAAAKGSDWCNMQLTPDQIEALRAEGFTIKEASSLFDSGYDIEW